MAQVPITLVLACWLMSIQKELPSTENTESHIMFTIPDWAKFGGVTLHSCSKMEDQVQREPAQMRKAGPHWAVSKFQTPLSFTGDSTQNRAQTRPGARFDKLPISASSKQIRVNPRLNHAEPQQRGSNKWSKNWGGSDPQFPKILGFC